MPAPIQLNQRAVLRLIASGHATSQRQIARDLRVPPNTIHGVIGRLLGRGLICLDRTERYGRGRPMQHYRIKRRRPVLVAQCLGSIWHAAVFADNRIRGSLHVGSCTPLSDLPEAVRELRKTRDAVLRKAGLDAKDIGGILLSINAVESGRGRIMTSSVLPWVRNASSEQFSKGLCCRVQLQQAVGTVVPELRARAANGVRSLAVLNVGDGVSAHGQIVDKVWGGHQAIAGEVGHVVAQPNGPLCGCGNRGCLEALIAGPALLNRVKRDVKNGAKTRLASALRGSPSDFFRHLESAENDAYARNLTVEFLDRVAWAVSIVMNMMTPDVIVLSGYALQGREGWRACILRRARELTLFGKSANIRLEFPLLGAQDYLRELAASFEESTHE